MISNYLYNILALMAGVVFCLLFHLSLYWQIKKITHLGKYFISILGFFFRALFSIASFILLFKIASFLNIALFFLGYIITLSILVIKVKKINKTL
jgi:hypothetical protein